MKALINATLVSAALLAGTIANATDFNVKIVNLTNGIWYTPFLVAAHPAGTSLFTVGQPASASLQMMAEGGDISGLVADLTTMGATIEENPAAGLLPPAMSTDVDLNTDDTSNVLLSVVAMLLPTNDAFVGLGAITIPTEPGSYMYPVPAFDAGTEANDELITGGGMPGVPGIPADPGGMTGTGAAPIGPAGSETVTISVVQNELPGLRISVASMLVNTNDAFSGLNAMSVGNMAVGDMVSRHSVAYDAGTEADTETAATIPGPAGGGEGFNAARDDQADRVSLHSGVMTFDDGMMGSDLTEQHRFDNPVTKIRIVRTQ